MKSRDIVDEDSNSRSRHRKSREDSPRKYREDTKSQSRSPRMSNSAKEHGISYNKSSHNNSRDRRDEDRGSRVKTAASLHHGKRAERDVGPDLGHAAVWGDSAKEEQFGSKNEPVDPTEIVKANFGLTGALAKDQQTGNIYNGVVLKWSEPLDAAGPDRNWRFYIFQGDKSLDTIHVHRQSAYLAGRESKVADILLDHPTCSKQHAVLQFRRTTDVSSGLKKVKPYIMDLESTNKTFLNGNVIEGSRYIELKEKDVLRFGESPKEFVFLCG